MLLRKIPSEVRNTLREPGSLDSVKRNASDFGQLLAGTFKQDVEPLSTHGILNIVRSLILFIKLYSLEDWPAI